jgi:hypothetical protein
MKKNIEKINEQPEISVRKGEKVTYGLKLDAATGDGEAGNFYTIEDGEEFSVPKADEAELAKREFGQGHVWLLKGKMKRASGVEEVTYFNLNILHRRDVEGKFVFPVFGEMKDIPERAKAICAAGGIKGTGSITYKRGQFDRQKNTQAVSVDETGKAIPVFKEATCANIVLL